MYNTHPDFSLVFRLRNSCDILIKMADHHDKHCYPKNATLSKMPGSLELQSACHDILPVCTVQQARRETVVSAMQLA